MNENRNDRYSETILILCSRTILQKEFEKAADENYFWSEGILMMPAKENRREMIGLFMCYGAKAPGILKWTQVYFLKGAGKHLPATARNKT